MVKKPRLVRVDTCDRCGEKFYMSDGKPATVLVREDREKPWLLCLKCMFYSPGRWSIPTPKEPNEAAS